MELADKKGCTGCGACAYVCPKQCISLHPDAIGAVYPEIDATLCIDCGRCQKFCPAISLVDRALPMQAFAAWSSDSQERLTSASGGVAAEIYKYAVDRGWSIVGAAFDEDFNVALKLSDGKEAISDFKNSKYIFSSTGTIFSDIARKLKEGGRVVVVALPCQIAAIKKIFHKNLDSLLLVDLVCHGVPPASHLHQYLRYIEKRCGETAATMSFRDADFGTQNYIISLSSKDGKRFYSNPVVNTNDIYQYGYHSMVAYRENCYHCHYANPHRASDITLSDYKGLGSVQRCRFSEEKVSCILVNSRKGRELIDALISEGRIEADARPVEEPIRGDRQLRHPSRKTFARHLFEREMAKDADFVRSMRLVYRRDRQRASLLWLSRLPLRAIRKVLRVLRILR